MAEIDTTNILDRTKDHMEYFNENFADKGLSENDWKMIESLAIKTRDGLTGLQKREDLDNAIDELYEKDIPHSVCAMDFRNMGGLNDQYGHEYTNDVIKEIMIDRVAKEVHDNGGELYRTGGDEYTAVVPYMEKEKLNDLMEDLTNRINNEVIKERGLQDIIHPKVDITPDNQKEILYAKLPTGVGVDYGIKYSKECTGRHELLQSSDDLLKTNKNIFINNLREKLKLKEVNNEHVRDKEKTEEVGDNRLFSGSNTGSGREERGSNFDKSSERGIGIEKEAGRSNQEVGRAKEGPEWCTVKGNKTNKEMYMYGDIKNPQSSVFVVKDDNKFKAIGFKNGSKEVLNESVNKNDCFNFIEKSHAMAAPDVSKAQNKSKDADMDI